MTVQERVVATMMAPEQKTLEEGAMVHKERWEEVRRRYFQERKAIAEIARGLDMDRKTVRRCVHEEQWQPYQRLRGGPTLLSAHEEYLRQRAEEVGYSAQILYQELRARGYCGSYETVKLFVRRAAACAMSGQIFPEQPVQYLSCPHGVISVRWWVPPLQSAPATILSASEPLKAGEKLHAWHGQASAARPTPRTPQGPRSARPTIRVRRAPSISAGEIAEHREGSVTP